MTHGNDYLSELKDKLFRILESLVYWYNNLNV